MLNFIKDYSASMEIIISYHFLSIATNIVNYIHEFSNIKTFLHAWSKFHLAMKHIFKSAITF